MKDQKSVEFGGMRLVQVLSVLLVLTGCGEAVDASGTGGKNPFVLRGGSAPKPNDLGGESGEDGGAFSTGGSEDSGGALSTGGSENSGGSASGGSEDSGGSENSGGALSTGGSENSGGSAAGGALSTGGSGPSPVCEPGDQRCSDEDLEVCDAEGQWKVSQTCPFVCFDDGINTQCTGVCEPDTKQCSAEGDSQYCNYLGQWIVYEECQNVCSNGNCTGSCPTGETQCAGDNVQVCNDQGSWDNVDTCEFVCSGAGDCIGVCEPGTVDCMGDTPRTCNSQGQWVAGSECPFLCSAGSCTGSCEPGTKKCSGSGTQTCNAQGSWDAAVACPAGPHETASCSGAGVCGKSCDSGYADCTGAAGCESDLTATTTCGSCNTACNPNPANAAPICTASGCGMICNAGWGDLNGNAADGCEYNVSSDPENCGQVGHSCFGGSCMSGVCEFPGIEEVSATTTGVQNLVAYGNYLYGTSWQGEIFRMGKDGSNRTVLATGYFMASPWAFMVEDDLIVWSGACGGTSGCTTNEEGIFKMSTSGGTVTRLSTSIPYMIDVEAGYVYWNDGFIDGSVLPLNRVTSFYRVSTSGGDSSLLGTVPTTMNAVSQVKVVGTKIYFAHTVSTCSAGSKCRFYRIAEYDISPWSYSRIIAQSTNQNGVIREMFGGSGILPVVFTIEGSTLYWAAGAAIWNTSAYDYPSGGQIGKTSLTAPDYINGTLLATDKTYGTFVVDADYVYYTPAVNSELRRVDINGGTPASLSPTSMFVGAITQDISTVYWASNALDSGTYSVYSIVK